MLQALVDLIKLVYEVVFHPLVFIVVCGLFVICLALYFHFKLELEVLLAKIKGWF
jgi:hypothetical protein